MVKTLLLLPNKVFFFTSVTWIGGEFRKLMNKDLLLQQFYFCKFTECGSKCYSVWLNCDFYYW